MYEFPDPTEFNKIWQDIGFKVFTHSNISCAFMAEHSRIDCHGFVFDQELDAMKIETVQN